MANLVLNGKSIDSINDIAENFVEADVMCAFQNGSLASWLDEYGYEDELERIRAIKPNASSIRVLAGISEALNLDDDVIAEAATRREEQRQKEDAARKAREERQRKEEEVQKLKNSEERVCRGDTPQSECREKQSIAGDHNGLPDIDKLLSNRNFDCRNAIKLYQAAADAGDAYAQACLSVCYSCARLYCKDSDRAKVCASTFEWAKKSAAQGNPIGQRMLGHCFSGGVGVEKDITEAVEWYRKAADQGDLEAKYYLAQMYSNGNGVQKNSTLALKLYRDAAEKGYSQAQMKMGSLYDNDEIDARGIVVEQNFETATYWYRKAAENGDALAQVYMGQRYFVGKGVAQSWEDAVYWFRKAAENGVSSAQRSLGICYRAGLGVKNDPAKARKWCNKAAKDGFITLDIGQSDKSYKILRKDDCGDCGLCAGLCPTRAIITKDCVGGIDFGKCSFCDACKDACPVGAINDTWIKDYTMCINCGACMSACPEGAISVIKGWEIDPDTCMRCGLCVVACPRFNIGVGDNITAADLNYEGTADTWSASNGSTIFDKIESKVSNFLGGLFS